MQAKKVMYFPHGHLKFQFVNNGKVSFWQDSKVADEKRLDSPYSVFNTHGGFAYNFNTFISTGQTKDDGFNHMPYSAYYQRFAVDIFRSDSLYIIGYSFGDDHINRMLYSFLKLSDRNKIYIVDYLKDIPKTIDAIGGIIKRIYDVFEPNWYVEEDNIDRHLKLFEDAIDDDGFGEIYDRVYFYRKGYQEFLEKDQDFILGPTCPFI